MAARRARKRAPVQEQKRQLHYKVVELSNVDEGALERTLNEWSPRGWTFDGVQFAMRESSKRPSMAFVFFTREGEALPDAPALEVVPHLDSYRDETEAAAHLKRLAGDSKEDAVQSAWERLQQLAEEGDS